MLWSAVTMTSKPLLSAAVSNSPLPSRPQPCSAAVRTLCSTRYRRILYGTFLSNRTCNALAFDKLFHAQDQAQVDLICLRYDLRCFIGVEIVQHRLNRHPRLIL